MGAISGIVLATFFWALIFSPVAFVSLLARWIREHGLYTPCLRIFIRFLTLSSKEVLRNKELLKELPKLLIPSLIVAILTGPAIVFPYAFAVLSLQSLIFAAILLVLLYIERRIRAMAVVHYTGEWHPVSGNPEKMPDFKRALWEAKYAIGQARARGATITWAGLTPKATISLIPWPEEKRLKEKTEKN